jgi:hypothetical protein
MLAEGNFNICELRSRNLAKRFDTPSDTIATEDRRYEYTAIIIIEK